MIKKAVSLICAILLAVSVCGCGSSKESGKSESSKKTSSEDTSSVIQPSTSSASSVKPAADRTLWKRKMVALTFDDGPQQTNPQLLDILKQKDAKATFFFIGENMEKYPEIVKRAIDEGHAVGYHSYAHNVQRISSQQFVSDNFDKAQPIIDGISPGYTITLYRGPGGGTSDIIASEAQKRDWRIVNWSNYGFNDHADQTATPEERIAGVFEGNVVSNGSVLLIHPRDNQDILNGIGLLIDKLKADGFECVTVTELLKRRNGGNAGELYAQGSPIY